MEIVILLEYSNKTCIWVHIHFSRAERGTERERERGREREGGYVGVSKSLKLYVH